MCAIWTEVWTLWVLSSVLRSHDSYAASLLTLSAYDQRLATRLATGCAARWTGWPLRSHGDRWSARISSVAISGDSNSIQVRLRGRHGMPQRRTWRCLYYWNNYYVHWTLGIKTETKTKTLGLKTKTLKIGSWDFSRPRLKPRELQVCFFLSCYLFSCHLISEVVWPIATNFATCPLPQKLGNPNTSIKICMQLR